MRIAGIIAAAFTTTETTRSPMASDDRPVADSAVHARATTIARATGRTTGPPNLAFGDARSDHATVASSGASQTNSHGSAVDHPHTPKAANTSSSSRNTSARTNQPNRTTLQLVGRNAASTHRATVKAMVTVNDQDYVRIDRL